MSQAPPPPADGQLEVWWSRDAGQRAAVLGAYLASPVVTRDADGKPGLADGALSFNAASSQGMGLMVVASALEVGADCEAIRPLDDLADVAATAFRPAERAWLAAAADPVAAFYALWTRKEAVLKALGLGLSFPIAEIDVSRGDFATAQAVAVPGHGDWWVASIPAPAGWAGAIAASGPFTHRLRTPVP